MLGGPKLLSRAGRREVRRRREADAVEPGANASVHHLDHARVLEKALRFDLDVVGVLELALVLLRLEDALQGLDVRDGLLAALSLDDEGADVALVVFDA